MAVKPPDSLKAISIYLKTAFEHDSRDPVIAYYCRLYAVQKGMDLDRKSPEGKQFLITQMDALDNCKKQLKDNESVMNETVGQAHVEEYALKLFSFADKRDRASDFSPATIKSFYTAGILLDVLSVFGEANEDIEKCRKYAKWKALYINQCLKSGQQPHPGPLGEEGAAEAPDMAALGATASGNTGFDGLTSVTPNNPPPFSSHQFPPPQSTPNSQQYQPPQQPPSYQPPPSHPAPSSQPSSSGGPPSGAPQLSMADFQRAEKLCKFAISSINYQDTDSAVDNLTKCLRLLTTGKEN